MFLTKEIFEKIYEESDSFQKEIKNLLFQKKIIQLTSLKKKQKINFFKKKNYLKIIFTQKGI